MTERFVSAAEMMCRVLGMPGYKFAVIGHPIMRRMNSLPRMRGRLSSGRGICYCKHSRACRAT
jgi:hypothetical protein